MTDRTGDTVDGASTPVAGISLPEGPVLALDTAMSLGSVAVGRSGRLLAEATLGVAVRHSESLLPAIRFVLDRAGVAPADLEAIVVGAGPGSFTGVRIAGATAKGMVHGLGIPLFAYSSLAGLAAGAGVTGRPVCALIDAHRDEVFAACYRFPREGGLEEVVEPSVIEVDDLAARLAEHSPVWVGEAALRFRDRLGPAGEVGEAPLALPRAASLLWLARHAPAAGRVANPAAWVPDYVRPPGVTPPP
jgi:tRNA threonylcarbamoyladenosine biosynthesis protein TsaB